MLQSCFILTNVVSVSACYLVRTLANCHLNYRPNDGGGSLFSGHFVYFPPDNVVFVASACPGRSDVVVLWSQSAAPGPCHHYYPIR